MVQFKDKRVQFKDIITHKHHILYLKFYLDIIKIGTYCTQKKKNEFTQFVLR